jgi:hypothetical protein
MKKLLFSAKMFAVIGVLFIFACKKEQPVATDNTIPTADAAYEVKNGTLHFKDADAFIKTLEEVRQLDMEKRSHFGEQLGFKSLLKCYVEVLKNAGSTDENVKDAYFQVLRDNADIITFQDNGIYHLTIDNQSVAPIVNRNGIMFIGQHAYKFTNFGQIIALDGNITALNSVNATTQSNNNILVMRTKKKLLSPCGVGRSLTKRNSSDNREGRFEISLTSTIVITSFSPTTHLPISTVINSSYSSAQPWKKTIWNTWRNYQTNNELAIDQRHENFSTECPVNDKFTYWNNWWAIDFQGASCSRPNVQWSEVSHFFSRFVRGDSHYRMTNTGIDIHMDCN